MKASITYYPNEVKKSQNTGKIPMYLRICLNGKKAETRLSSDVTDKDLTKWNPTVMRFSERSFFVNHILNKLDEKFHEFLILNSNNLYKYHPADIRDYVLGKPKNAEVPILAYTHHYFIHSVKPNTKLSRGTIKNYEKAIKHLEIFIKYKGLEKLAVSKIDNSIVLQFKDYLLGSIPGVKKIGMTEPSAAGIIKKFRTIFNRAVEQDHLLKNPFKCVKLKVQSPLRQRLNIHQVKTFVDLKFDHCAVMEIYRDMFLFSVFTGLAYHDAVSLNQSNLDFRSDGTVKLSVYRAKTDILTEMFLVSPALALIKKYSDQLEVKATGKVLPRRSNKELNAQLKILGNMANFPIRLSSHIARHTFRQLLAEAGVEDMAVIKRMMGHSRGGSIDEVYYSVTESKLMEAKNKFETYLLKHSEL